MVQGYVSPWDAWKHGALCQSLQSLRNAHSGDLSSSPEDTGNADDHYPLGQNNIKHSLMFAYQFRRFSSQEFRIYNNLGSLKKPLIIDNR